ncbi:MAG TPA: hypothetical protein DCG72_05450 [Gammaproteobacteria bacterium]|nr:hypothetical protein [Gammaproteobacteria bacterium]
MLTSALTRTLAPSLARDRQTLHNRITLGSAHHADASIGCKTIVCFGATHAPGEHPITASVRQNFRYDQTLYRK